MAKALTNLNDLQSLARSVAEVRILNPDHFSTRAQNYKFYHLHQDKHKKSGFLGISFPDYEALAGKLANEHERNYKHLPDEIHVSSEIAFVLAEDDDQFQSKANAAHKEGLGAFWGMGSAMVVAMLFPSPLHAASAGQNFLKAIISDHAYHKKVQEFVAERNKDANEILGVYKLSKIGNEYVLSKGSWQVATYQTDGRVPTTAYAPTYVGAGIDDSVNLNQLREEMKAKIDLAKGRDV